MPALIFRALLFFLTTSTALAGPLGLPDSARPGAVRPEETGKGDIPAAPAAQVMDIPKVIDRPFEVDEGPLVAIQQFRVLDAKDLPAFGISQADVQQLLNELLAKRPEGFTIGQLQEVADQVTRHYREKGLILAQAVLPVQTIQGGVVDIQLFEGILGRVLTESNEMYNEAILKAPFKHLIGKPVTKDTIESALLQLTDFPGLSIFGVFQPGQAVGTADIVLRVQKEKRFDVAYRIDNQGLPETGRGRFRPTVEWNNVTGGADRLTMSIQQTYRPKNNTFRALDYDRYLGRGFKAGATWNRNTFDVGGEFKAQSITGETKQFGAFVEKSWLRSRQMNLSSRVALNSKNSNTRTRGRFTNQDQLSVFTLDATFDNVDTRFKGINFATLELSHGVNDLFGAMGSHISALEKPAGLRPSRRGGPADSRFASGQFTKVFATASRLQTVKKNLSVLVRGEYHWSNSLLVPMEQYSAGGPDNVRAFPAAQALLDRAAFGSVEFIHNMPFITDVQAFGNRSWGELVQISAFYDHAVGRLNKPLPNDPKGYVNFKGAGLQVRFTLPSKIESRLMWAWEVGSDEADNGRRPQIWGDLTYRF